MDYLIDLSYLKYYIMLYSRSTLKLTTLTAALDLTRFFITYDVPEDPLSLHTWCHSLLFAYHLHRYRKNRIKMMKWRMGGKKVRQRRLSLSLSLSSNTN